MSSNNSFLARDKDLVRGLKTLYESYGYKKFKMSKFEQYDLYLENKSFLRNGNIITVTDPKGRLLALKPDITLSIVKNLRAASLPEKVYYTENVYSTDNDNGEIKEITQVGLEYIGELDVRSLGEILLLAAESLSYADESYRIAISHMGLISDVLDSANVAETEKSRILKMISDKNLHGLRSTCASLGIDSAITERLLGLISICGRYDAVIDDVKALVCGKLSEKAFAELSSLSTVFASFGLSDKFLIDFSVMNDMNYYNGIVFQGFINGIPKSVLSGGRYDNLVRRFGCDGSAVGFAVSVDLLSTLNYGLSENDCEVFLLYSEECDPVKVLQAQRNFALNGERCIALSKEQSGIKYGRRVIMCSDGSMSDE